MPVPMVFISSTFLEFEDERRILQSKLTKTLPVGCRLAEYLSCETPELEEKLKRCIDEADVVVLLLGIRYGSGPGEISWTEREVKYALERDKRVLAYMKQQEPPPTVVDIDIKKQEALQRFKAYVKEKIGNIPRFSDTYDLIALAVRDIHGIVKEFERTTYEEGFDG